MKLQTHCLLAAATACAVFVAGSTDAATISWQGGAGAFTDANWTVDATPNQNHPSFGVGDNVVVHNTTINGGSVTAFNGANVGVIGGGDSLLITGGASVSGDFITAGVASHASDVTLASGSITLSSNNALRSTSAFDGMIDFTGAAGSATVAQTDLSGTNGQALAGKISSATGTASYFRIDGTLITTNGVAYNGSNLAAINAELALNVVGDRYFLIEEAGGVQTLTLVPEPGSLALLGLGGLLVASRRRRG